MLAADAAAGAGEGCCGALWAFALKQVRPRQTVKIQAMSFLMATNLTFFDGSCKSRSCKARCNSSHSCLRSGLQRQTKIVRGPSDQLSLLLSGVKKFEAILETAAIPDFCLKL